ncbi:MULTISPECIES: DUF924 family protein [Gammaproteobacteria]|uniref:DUF924 family protein n=1 Tax=Gammaproteobacteria TaxID=1236 RepID=UPI000DD03893|nr:MULTISPECIES: DUF924 family protein [Gammaproteobacteria]RTE85822.1 DUF924 domain-containing protein [Aliidiomarina sp. B3213]TCZ90177.1 DUF924 domain-containing protein [Lysobacter sp. N42]
MVTEAHEVLDFWFQELKPSQWFMKDDSLDTHITERFNATHEAGSKCELWHWRGSARGRLAEVIVLDQFSRNIHRNSPLAFATDALALALAQEAIERGHDQSLTPEEQAFLYMPYMHSESKHIHELALDLFNQPGLETNYEFEVQHKAIIDRFGRYPHRNSILGRTSSQEEIEFLQHPGSSF